MCAIGIKKPTTIDHMQTISWRYLEDIIQQHENPRKIINLIRKRVSQSITQISLLIECITRLVVVSNSIGHDQWFFSFKNEDFSFLKFKLEIRLLYVRTYSEKWFGGFHPGCTCYNTHGTCWPPRAFRLRSRALSILQGNREKKRTHGWGQKDFQVLSTAMLTPRGTKYRLLTPSHLRRGHFASREQNPLLRKSTSVSLAK